MEGFLICDIGKIGIMIDIDKTRIESNNQGRRYIVMSGKNQGGPISMALKHRRVYIGCSTEDFIHTEKLGNGTVESCLENVRKVTELVDYSVNVIMDMVDGEPEVGGVFIGVTQEDMKYALCHGIETWG